MPIDRPPTSSAQSEGPLAALEGAMAGLPRAEARLARYFLDHADQIPFEGTEAIAVNAGVSRMAIWRLCRRLGYENFSALKQALRESHGPTPWLSGNSYRQYLEAAPSGAPLREALEAEVAALEAVYRVTSTPAWEACVQQLAHAEKIWVAGFRIGHSLARLVGNGLKIFRPGVTIVDADGGDLVDVLAGPAPGECVVLVALHTYSPKSERHHSEATMRFARMVQQSGRTLIVIGDPQSGWVRELTPLVLSAEVRNGLFWGTLGPLVSLGGLLVDAVIRARKADIQNRITLRMDLFDQFEGGTAREDRENPAEDK